MLINGSNTGGLLKKWVGEVADNRTGVSSDYRTDFVMAVDRGTRPW